MPTSPDRRPSAWRRRVGWKARAAGLGLFATLAIPGAVLLNLPHVAPGLRDAHAILVLVVGLGGVLATIPAAWRLQRRFARTRLRAALGSVAVLAWVVGLAYAVGVSLFLTAPVGFLTDRVLTTSFRSADGGVVFYEYQMRVFGKPASEPEIALRRGPFEIVVDCGAGDREITAFGHHLETRDGEAWIDGRPALVEHHESW